MAISESNLGPGSVGARDFRTTHWSVVLLAGQDSSPDAAAALDQLCRMYWYPLYAFVRRYGHSPEEAQDLTQSFFAHLLQHNRLGTVSPEKGRFRSFLLGALKNFLANEWDRATRQKRGGGQVLFSLDEMDAEQRYALEPADELTAETIYERRWAQTVLECALGRLRAEFDGTSKEKRYDALKECLLGDDDVEPYAEIGARLGMTESAVKSAMHRMRQRYAELVREEIARTVATSAEVEEELRHLFEVLGT